MVSQANYSISFGHSQIGINENHCIVSLCVTIRYVPAPRKLCNTPTLLTPVEMQSYTAPHPTIHSCSLQNHNSHVHDHFISPLGARVLRFEFSCGAVPPTGGDATDLDCSLSRPTLSLRTDDISSRIDGAAIDDRDARSIDVRGRRLLLAEPAISELVLRCICNCGPSRLFGRYRISLPFGGAAIRLGVTLPSIKAEDADDRPICVGVSGADILCCSPGGVKELFRLAARGRPLPPLSGSLSRLVLTSSLAIFRTRTALSFSARRWIASKSL